VKAGYDIKTHSIFKPGKEIVVHMETQDQKIEIPDPGSPRPIRRLMTAVIQIQDFDNAVTALTEAGMTLTHMASTGGFLGRRNVTLLIGMDEDQEDLVVRILSQSCRRRVEYIATPLEGAPFHLPLSTPVDVGGATIFTFAVERFEEIA